MTPIDWTIAVVLSVLIGLAVLFTRRYMKDVSGFIVGGRKARTWLMLSNTSSGGLGLIAIVYCGQEGFLRGYSFVWIVLMASVIRIIVFGIFGFGIERFRATKAMTAGQFQEMRYSRGVRLLVGSVMGFGGLLNMTAFPIAAGVFLKTYLDLPEQVQLLGVGVNSVHLILAIIISLAVFFAAFCGQIGVLFSDYLQGIVIMVGLFSVNYLIWKYAGGYGNIKLKLGQEIGAGAFNPFLAGSYGILWILWRNIQVIMGPFTSGTLIAKFATADNPKVTRKMMLVTNIFAQGKNVLMVTLGVGALMYFGGQIPETAETEIYSKTITPIFLREFVPPVLMGILFTAFIFAFISTNDTYLLAFTSIIVNDVICAGRKKPLSSKSHIRLLRFVIILSGLFLFLWSVFYVPETSILNYIMITGMTWFGSGIALLAGLYWKRANTAGAYGAIIAAIILPVLDLTFRKTWPLYNANITSAQAGLTIIGVCVGLLVILSLASKAPTKFVDYGKLVRESEKKD